jgi:hypothetical protein
MCRPRIRPVRARGGGRRLWDREPPGNRKIRRPSDLPTREAHLLAGQVKLGRDSLFVYLTFSSFKDFYHLPSPWSYRRSGVSGAYCPSPDPGPELHYQLKTFFRGVPVLPVKEGGQYLFEETKRSTVSHYGKILMSHAVIYGKADADEGNVFIPRDVFCVGVAEDEVRSLLLHKLVEEEHVGAGPALDESVVSRASSLIVFSNFGPAGVPVTTHATFMSISVRNWTRETR